jgi:hypothetical protein
VARKNEKKPEQIPGSSWESPSFPGTSGLPSVSTFRKVSAQPTRRPYEDYQPRELRELLLELEGIVQKLRLKFPALAETWRPNETEREAAVIIEDANQRIQELTLELIRQGGLETSDTGLDEVGSPQKANGADPSHAPPRHEHDDAPEGLEHEEQHEPHHKRGRAALNYRSEIKRAILVELTRQPRATDAEICRGLDADGAAELPKDWKNKPGDRGFFDAYSDPRTRHKVEVAISKVRRDLRKLGLLA